MVRNPNTCRLCHRVETDHKRLVKYSTRAYAHHDCYLIAGKSLDALTPWQVGRFQYRILQEHGLLDKAMRITEANQEPRDRAAGE